MLTETIYLREEDCDVKMQTFIHDDTSNVIAGKRSAMVVLAGGGYLFQANDREGEPVAISYFANGFNCFLVNYSVNTKAAFPRPVEDVSRAIVHVKRNAEKYNIDPERVYVIGFSAGGHLAASIGTFWAEDWARSDPDMAEEENKPRAILACYPVITGDKSYYHHDSFMRLLGYPISKTDATEEELNRYSIEKHISDKTVPAFIWHTFEDTCVPLENSLMYAKALKEKGIHFEMHIYPKGDHGLALANRETWWGADILDDPHVAEWFRDSLEFMKLF
ncbi:MAG: alpha/beta hydrolase [Ruminococcaceae bacterium]|nr:alpha/beta hydrolase [Oscillospiraceae bacterium]